jgi:hypothetical protein
MHYLKLGNIYLTYLFFYFNYIYDILTILSPGNILYNISANLHWLSSLQWFYIDNIIGVWFGFKSVNRFIYYITSLKYTDDVGVYPCFTIGPSLLSWQSIYTHLNPFYKSTKYLYARLSLDI